MDKLTKLTDEQWRQWHSVHEAIFGVVEQSEWQARLLARPHARVLFAEQNGQIVGYKLGYERSADTFYSWLGGVLPSERGKGIGKQLMLAQHDECRRLGYTTIETKTMNRWRSMLLLNIACGFNIIGTEYDASLGDIKILLAKSL